MAIELEEKRALFAQLEARVRQEHETLLAAQKATQEGATHEEARPENDKDTRALEQSYLARGQAERVASLEADVETLERLQVNEFSSEMKVALGAFIVTEDENGAEQNYLLAPAGAGEVLSSNAGPVKVVTQKAPLGRALLGSVEGDDVEVQSPTGTRILSLTSVI